MIRRAVSTTRRRRGVTRARRGFSLVAMMVAMILLVVGLMSLATANASTTTLQTLAQNRTNAIAIGRAYVEEVRTRDPWLVETESAARLTADGQVSGSGVYVRTLTVTEVKQNLVQIDVKVDYPRGNRPVELSTMLFRGNGLAGAQ